MSVVQDNSKVWEDLYSQGKGVLTYPNESMVRLTYGLLNTNEYKNILDYGFGAAANLIHLARRGFAMTGAEVSPSAIEIAKKRLQQEQLQAALQLVSGSTLPFTDGQFDVVIAWQVLYYNNWDTLRVAMAEIERVLRPGGIFIGTMAGVGDVSHTMGTSIGDCQYISNAPGQEGAHLLILDRADLVRCFPDRALTLGEFAYNYGSAHSHHFIITYSKPG